MSGAKAAGVLLIANNFAPVRGGSAVVYDNLARHADSRIMVLAPKRNYLDGLPVIGWREHDRRAPYRIVRLELLRTIMPDEPQTGVLRRVGFVAEDLWIRLRAASTTLRLIRRHRIRTVCIGELLSSSWLLLLLRRLVDRGLRLRLIAYVHGEEITTEDAYDPARKRRRAALEAADHVVVVSRFTHDVVLSLLGETFAGRISLIENGVDTERFKPGPTRADLIEQYGLQGCFVFVSVCRLLEKKGVDNAIRAFAKLSAIRANIRFVIVGTGPFEAALRELVAESSLGQTVVFTGPVTDSDLPAHYRLGDVFVMPNRELANGDTEGFGLVFLEANACGLPVIAGRDGGSTDAVTDDVNGLLVDGHSVDRIMDAMRRLHDDPALRRNLATRGLQRARQAGWSEKSKTLLSLSAP